MKKFFLCALCAVFIFALSCKNDPFIPPEREITGFPSPDWVNAYQNAGSVYVKWENVENAIDYQMYVKNSSGTMVRVFDYEFDGYPTYLIDNEYFKSLSTFGSSPYYVGILAVSYTGMYSEITWSKSFITY